MWKLGNLLIVHHIIYTIFMRLFQFPRAKLKGDFKPFVLMKTFVTNFRVMQTNWNIVLYVLMFGKDAVIL